MDNLTSNNLPWIDAGVCSLTTNNFDPQDPSNDLNCNPTYCTIEGRSPYVGFATVGCSVVGIYIDHTAIVGYAICGNAIVATRHSLNVNPYFNINDTGYTYLNPPYPMKSPL